MKLGQHEARRNPTCWNRDAQARALRVELADESFYLFPYGQLAFVRFEKCNDHDNLRVCIGTHTIQITGQRLRELGLALQKLAVDWVRELPPRHGSMVGDDDVWIKSITVSEAGE